MASAQEHGRAQQLLSDARCRWKALLPGSSRAAIRRGRDSRRTGGRYIRESCTVQHHGDRESGKTAVVGVRRGHGQCRVREPLPFYDGHLDQRQGLLPCPRPVVQL